MLRTRYKQRRSFRAQLQTRLRRSSQKLTEAHGSSQKLTPPAHGSQHVAPALATMQISMILFGLMALLSIGYSLPVESVVEDAQDVELVDPNIVDDAAYGSHDELVRERRSPFQPQRSNRFPQPQAPQPRGSISGGVTRQKGVGTVVHGQGQGNVWTSRDGNSRVDAQGEWSKVVRGPARGKPSYNVGATFEHRF